MSTRRITLHTLKEILRLKYQGDLSVRQIARSLNLESRPGGFHPEPTLLVDVAERLEFLTLMINQLVVLIARITQRNRLTG